MFSRMVFLTDIFQDTVGDITTNAIHEIKDEYYLDEWIKTVYFINS